MQEQDHFNQEEQQPERQAKRVDGIYSFHEVVYPPPEINRPLQYFIGLAIGCIPLALFFLSISRFLGIAPAFSALGAIAFYGYFALWPAAIVCLCISRVRFVGYGLLTMAIISPVIWTITCFATFRACYRAC
ncbi:hypothetical protein KSF_037620 [Reticulibacter mediterranei]|uniref:Uncharacterized protein n=1 Tax=Reticulibacter mediterranei TaxID=2778369 RepID=A0A8J3N009_9CHLR|nr:hypothetical protein [Reticulibacter mediterranei]GHO93714.1 hypothetical protein KSF_037620 [Reticulibacter mediterranei]